MTADELLEALEARVRYLRKHPEEIVESCGSCYWFETHERYNLHTGVEEVIWPCCTRDPEVYESTVATMV